MALVKVEEKDANGEIVSERYINPAQVATITVEKDAKSAAVVMSNGDCIIVPKEIVGKIQ